MKTLLLLLLSILLPITAIAGSKHLKQSAPDLDFRGIKIGTTLREVNKIASEIAVSEIIEGENRLLFAAKIKNIPVRIFIDTEQGIVTQMAFRFSRKNYSEFKDAIIEKFGKKFTSSTEYFTNGFGAKFEFDKCRWESKTDFLYTYEKSPLDDLESIAIIGSKKQVQKYAKDKIEQPGF